MIFFKESDSLFWKIIILISGLAFISLLVISFVYPLLKSRENVVKEDLHSQSTQLQTLEVPTYSRIAIALDFSGDDQKLLAHALGQGRKQTKFLLIHVVESVPARIYENESDDLETEKDKEHLLSYALQLKERGYEAEPFVGFGKTCKGKLLDWFRNQMQKCL